MSSSCTHGLPTRCIRNVLVAFALACFASFAMPVPAAYGSELLGTITTNDGQEIQIAADELGTWKNYPSSTLTIDGGGQTQDLTIAGNDIPENGTLDLSGGGVVLTDFEVHSRITVKNGTIDNTETDPITIAANGVLVLRDVHFPWDPYAGSGSPLVNVNSDGALVVRNVSVTGGSLKKLINNQGIIEYQSGVGSDYPGETTSDHDLQVVNSVDPTLETPGYADYECARCGYTEHADRYIVGTIVDQDGSRTDVEITRLDLLEYPYYGTNELITQWQDHIVAKGTPSTLVLNRSFFTTVFVPSDYFRNNLNIAWFMTWHDFNGCTLDLNGLSVRVDQDSQWDLDSHSFTIKNGEMILLGDRGSLIINGSGSNYHLEDVTVTTTEPFEINLWSDSTLLVEGTTTFNGPSFEMCDSTATVITSCGDKTDYNQATVQREHRCNQQVVADEFLATPATCTEAATYYLSCACGAKHSETETFTSGTPFGHSWVAGAAVAPTATEDGYTPYTCERCGATEKRDIVPATGQGGQGGSGTPSAGTNDGSTAIPATFDPAAIAPVLGTLGATAVAFGTAIAHHRRRNPSGGHR